MATLTNTSIQDIINSAVKVAVKNKVVWIYGKEANTYNVVSIPVFKDFINNEGDINGVTIINKERLMDRKTIAVVKNYSTDVNNLNGVFADMVSKEIANDVFEKSSTEDLSNPMGYCHNYSCSSRDKANKLSELDTKRKAIGRKLDKVEKDLVSQQMFLKKTYGVGFNYKRPVIETGVPVYMGQTFINKDGITIDCSSAAWSPIVKRNGDSNTRTVENLKAKFSYKAISMYDEDVEEFNDLKQELWDLRIERKAVKAEIERVKQEFVDHESTLPEYLLQGLKNVNYNVNPVNRAGMFLRAKAQLVHVEYKYDESGNRFTVCPHCGEPIRIDSVRKFVAVDATKDMVIDELKPAEYIIDGVKYVINLRGEDVFNQKAQAEVQKVLEAKAKAKANGKKYVRKERNLTVNEDYNPNQWSDEELGYTSTAEGNDYREASISEEDMQDFWGQGGADIDAERLEEYAKLMISHRNEKSWYKHVRNVSDDIVKVGALTANKWNDSFKLGGFKYYDFVQYEMEVRGNMGLQLNMEKIEQYYNSSKSVVKAMDYDMGDSYDVETGNGGKYTVEDSFYTDMDRYYSNMESNYEDFFTEYGGEFTQGIYNEDEMYGQVQVRPDFKARYERICTIMTRLSK